MLEAPQSIVLMNPEPKLAQLGLTLPNPPAAAGAYVPTVRTGNLLFALFAFVI